MRVLRFDSGDQASADNYQWIVTAFNAADTRGQSGDQTRKNIDVLGKLLAVSVPDDAGEPWPFMDEAHVLRPGPQEVALTETELKWLESQYRLGMGVFRPMVQVRHFARCLAALQDAPVVGADEASERGAAGAPEPSGKAATRRVGPRRT